MYNIYVEEDIIYTGNLSEMPIHHRENLKSALENWGDVLSKRSLNELIYSTFYWYREKIFHCKNCNYTSDENNICSECGFEMFEKYLHERNKQIDKIFDCIGMITAVSIVNK